MEYIKIGFIANTHGIKGELRIKSDFKFKEKVFKKGNILYIGSEKIEEEIKTYRTHKDYDMVTFSNYNDINEVLKYKGEEVFFKKEEIKLNDKEYYDEELLNFNIIFNNDNIGVLTEITDAGNGNELFVIKKEKEFYIPRNEHFIEKIDFINKQIILKNIEGLI